MTEAEAWESIADYMEGTGEMVPCDTFGETNCDGLCSSIYSMADDNVITPRVMHKMMHRLLYVYGREHHPTDYYWPEGRVAPRIKACRRLAELARRER